MEFYSNLGLHVSACAIKFGCYRGKNGKGHLCVRGARMYQPYMNVRYGRTTYILYPLEYSEQITCSTYYKTNTHHDSNLPCLVQTYPHCCSDHTPTGPAARQQHHGCQRWCIHRNTWRQALSQGRVYSLDIYRYPRYGKRMPIYWGTSNNTADRWHTGQRSTSIA